LWQKKGKWFHIKVGEISSRYKEEVFYYKGGEALAQVAQRGGGCPILETQRGGRGSELPLSCGCPCSLWGVGTPWKIPSTSNDSVKQQNAVFDFCWHRRSGAAFGCFPRGTPLPRARSPGLPAASCHRRLVAAQRPSRRRSPAPYLRAPRGAAAAAGTVLRCCPQLPGRAPPGPGSGLLLPAGDTAGREAGLRLGQVGAGAAGRGDEGTRPERDRNEPGRYGSRALTPRRGAGGCALRLRGAGGWSGCDVTTGGFRFRSLFSRRRGGAVRAAGGK